MASLPRSGSQSRRQQEIASSAAAASSLPPEIIATVFEYLPLKDLIPHRRVSSQWKKIVDTEAKVRMALLVNDPKYPLVLQAGPPALYDVSEYLPLKLDTFPQQASQCPVTASLAIVHSDSNPCHTSSMAEDENQAFQNIVLSITRVERLPETRKVIASNMPFGRWSSWELVRATDRIWREWWEQGSSSSSPFTSRHSSPVNDSGFAETATEEEMVDKSSRGSSPSSCGSYCVSTKTLDIGKTLSRATMDVSCVDTGNDEIRHEYRWKTLELDVYKFMLGFEERNRRTGMRAVLGSRGGEL